MSENLKACLPLLEAYPKLQPAKRRQLVTLFERCIFWAIQEMAGNLIAGNIPMSDSDKKTLCRYKKALAALSRKKLSHTRTRRIINQSGRGFLPALIPLVIAAISAFQK
jgi:hypothetical protein